MKNQLSVLDVSREEIALARSAVYEAMALGLRPPTKELMARLGTEEQIHDFANITCVLDAEEIEGEKKNTENLSEVVCSIMQNMPLDLENLQSLYGELFGHTARPKVPLYETEYGSEELVFQQPYELCDIAGFYSAFHLRMNSHERADNIVCECEFMCFLARKEAYSLEIENADMYEQTRRAQRLFLRDHLAKFAPAFGRLLEKEAIESFYKNLGSLCYHFIIQECARFDVTPGCETPILRTLNEAVDCASCGCSKESTEIPES